MAIALTCPQGHTFQRETNDSGGPVRCPVCQLAVAHSTGPMTDKGMTGETARKFATPPGPPLERGGEERELAEEDAGGMAAQPVRSLWEVMQHGAEVSAGSPAFDQAPAEQGDDPRFQVGAFDRERGPESTAEMQEAGDAGTETDRPKGLWGLMRQSRSSAEQADERRPGDAMEPATPAPKGLWGVMKVVGIATEADDRDVAEQPADGVQSVRTDAAANSREPAEDAAEDVGDGVEDELSDEFDEFDDTEPDEEDWDADDSAGAETSLYVPESEPSVAIALGYAVPKSGRSSYAVIAVSLGVASVLLSSLGVLPDFWAKLPATISGLLAMVFGMLAVTEIRASRGRMSGLVPARAAMVAGLAGIFLGPTVFNDAGERMRTTSGRRETRQHLEALGSGLAKYHDGHGHFPAGGVFEVRDGKEVPMHGWMTALLPHLGHQAVHNRIDFSQPYDAAGNREAMGVVIPGFLAAGNNEHTNARGFGLAHFAAVGGEMHDPERGYLALGIFDRNSKVARDDVSDGLSQTLIVGEVANQLPPWGLPDNWRKVGKGLNRDYYGFGNPDQSGATFLLADGSVRYFSNSTSVRVLEQLSTRAGSEPQGRE